MSRDRSFVVIPAYNEQTRIGSVIEAALGADQAYVSPEVIVVDNNSSDATAAIAISQGATVLACESQGKGWAMLTGATYALEKGAAALTFLDADPIGLKSGHINQLVRPVLADEATMVIGYLGGRLPIAKKVLDHWGGFSGQRTVSLEVWNCLRPADFKGWRTEGALNAVCRNLGLGDRIQRIELDGLYHLGKRSKEPNLLHATWRYAQTYSSAFRGLLSRSGAIVEPVAV